MTIKEIKRPWQKRSLNRNSDNFYQTRSWKKLVDFIWMRDNSICQVCKANGILHRLERGTRDINRQGTVDHKQQRKQGGTDDPENLWLIGSNHHAQKSAEEGNKMRL